MKVIYNNLIPLRGFVVINLFGVIFVRRGYTLDRTALNHEAIHTAQMREMFYVLFYLWYVAEWLLRLLGNGNAYENISFEREAYSNQADRDYLKCRKRYAWWNYMHDKHIFSGKKQNKHTHKHHYGGNSSEK